MTLQIRVTCSNHRMRDGTFGREDWVWVDTLDEKTPELVRGHLERRDWIVQFNGEHMDTYCSKKCAE